MPLMTPAEVARYLGVHDDTVTERCEVGYVPHLRLTPSTVRFDEDALQTWLDAIPAGERQRWR